MTISLFDLTKVYTYNVSDELCDSFLNDALDTIIAAYTETDEYMIQVYNSEEVFINTCVNRDCFSYIKMYLDGINYNS